ncbi:MAG: threonine--tRNA ligase [Rhodospirillaceae bacterium]|jgi:threonyl-tRNA synthetase|nr:threonine--tRNA ligase [Rhodospirillaceae bacterium]
MIVITLPDESLRYYDHPVTGSEIARDISACFEKHALALRVNGKLMDLSTVIAVDATIYIVTCRDSDALMLLRHSASHVMAEAVKELYPESQVTIGPSIDNGFYYDFARSISFIPDDLEKIEVRMCEIVARNETITREEWARDDAIAFFEGINEKYKAEIIASIPIDQTISLYRQGKFIDLCRGPHLPSTAKLGKAFKLMNVAGAYWHGDSRKEMLQRIYGTAWFNDTDLKSYINIRKEAEKRDHRRLGREMNLFHQQDEAIGSVFWHPNGWTLWRIVENYLRNKLEKAKYVEVKTPQLLDRSLWEASGHWEKFGTNMFTIQTPDERTLAIKPMSCPCHVQIFRAGIRSYRDLPMRMAEFGSCHRYEPSGAMHGIMRVRAFTQDDAHIFCTEDQITSETVSFCELLKIVYRDFGFDEVRVRFSDRPAIRAGSDEIWNKAESALLDAANVAGLEVTRNPGEGTFYGPKLEFVLRDAIGRDWQCGTLQVDFVMPKCLDATYISENGKKKNPVMIHRAILGSFERFIGILIEHHAGRFPLWLAPVQLIIATITNKADDYANLVFSRMKKVGLRVDLDLRNEKINYKIREHYFAKVPILLIVGNHEVETNTVAIRRLGNEIKEILALEDAVSLLTNEAYRN